MLNHLFIVYLGQCYRTSYLMHIYVMLVCVIFVFVMNGMTGYNDPIIIYSSNRHIALAGLDLNFQGHLSRWTSEIEKSPVLHEMTPVCTIMYVIIFLIIDLSCRTSVIIIQPVRGAIFQNFYLSGMVGQSLRSSPAWWPLLALLVCFLIFNLPSTLYFHMP